jgi:dephospho-CoA kinase
MIKAGLTGNYGMGKSSVLSLFASLGAFTLDCDLIVEQLLEEKDVIEKIKKILGSNMTGPDGRLDKKAVADRVFHDRADRKRLEDLLHPLVFVKLDDSIKGISGQHSVVIAEVPLLFEGNYRSRFDRVITVHTTADEAVRRLMQSGISREEIEARLKAQMPVKEKIALSDFAIDNNGLLSETRKQVEAVYDSLLRDSC